MKNKKKLTSVGLYHDNSTLKLSTLILWIWKNEKKIGAFFFGPTLSNTKYYIINSCVKFCIIFKGLF